MTTYKFGPNDIFNNRIEAHSRHHFYVIDGTLYYDKAFPSENTRTAPVTDTVLNVPDGHISLYELNVNRDISSLGEYIYPFITKQGALTSFSTVSTQDFQSYTYGTTITGSYPLSSSISAEYITASSDTVRSRRLKALKTTFDNYSHISPHYAYSSSLGNKEAQDINLVSVPSIFYGSSIEKGTVDLRFYISGSLVGQLQDTRKNGELKQILPIDANVGKVAGVVLYNEGVVALTGSWDIDAATSTHDHTSPALVAPKWRDWGVAHLNTELHPAIPLTSVRDVAIPAVPAGAATYSVPADTAWSINFQGTSFIPTITMLAHAPKGELNHSNNPTYVDKTSVASATTDTGGSYIENPKQTIKNVVKSPYADPTGSFSKETYISKIGIYDEENNLIAIAKLATPVRKTEDREFTFKIKMDI